MIGLGTGAAITVGCTATRARNGVCFQHVVAEVVLRAGEDPPVDLGVEHEDPVDGPREEAAGWCGLRGGCGLSSYSPSSPILVGRTRGGEETARLYSAETRRPVHRF